MDFSRRHILVALLASPLAPAWGQAEEEATLTKEQEERLKKYLPRTFPKMQQRHPILVAVCSDEISGAYEPGAVAPPAAHVMSWYGRFLDRLGAAFFYHGGVVDFNAPAAGAGKELQKQWDEYRKLRAQWEKTKKGEPPKIPGVPPPEAGGPERALSVNDLLRLSQPPESRVPASSAFFARSYAEVGAVAVQVFDPLLSLAFHTEEKASPDIVVIAYGAHDALEGNSLATFRAVLETAVAECRKKGADVILAGPPPAIDEADERAAAGRARPWAAVMREVADAAGIFFADLGAAAVYQPSDLLNRTVETCYASSIEPVRRMFDHGMKVQDRFHPNAGAHVRMGETTADWMKNGEPARPFDVASDPENNTGLFLGAGPDGDDLLVIRVANKTKEQLTIALCPLRFAGWTVKPGSPDRVHTFQIDSAKDPMPDPPLPPKPWPRLFKFGMKRNAEPLQGHEEFIRGSVIICDDDAQHLVDVKVIVKPLMLLWPEERMDGAAGDCLLKCTLVNTAADNIDAALTVDWQGKQIPLPPVPVAAGQRQAVPLRLPLPPVESAFRFKDTVAVTVTVDGRAWTFLRRIEGVRHAGLNQKLPLVPLSRWRSSRASPEDAAAAGVQLTIQADTKAIYFLVEVPAEIVSDVVEGKPWGRLEVQIDGRRAGENGTLGCVGKVVMEIPRQDGTGLILPVRPAAFGNGYNFPYPAGGFVSPVNTTPDGGRRIQFNMLRIFLKYHEWSLDGGGQNDLGINVRLFLCDGKAGGYSDAKTFVLSASGFPSADARSLTVLELLKTPSARWSLRIG